MLTYDHIVVIDTSKWDEEKRTLFLDSWSDDESFDNFDFINIGSGKYYTWDNSRTVGNRDTLETVSDLSIWSFKSKRDALMFKLRWS